MSFRRIQWIEIVLHGQKAYADFSAWIRWEEIIWNANSRNTGAEIKSNYLFFL